ncbi:hypothetical protein ABT234_15590 [Streptomyces sp. NPDC001586]|uniref:hypothetical protein n=1 Tax=Streptomyces sp. NPDC001586 TaxID=3154387 RepID=UPI00332D4C98
MTADLFGRQRVACRFRDQQDERGDIAMGGPTGVRRFEAVHSRLVEGPVVPFFLHDRTYFEFQWQYVPVSHRSCAFSWWRVLTLRGTSGAGESMGYSPTTMPRGSHDESNGAGRGVFVAVAALSRRGSARGLIDQGRHVIPDDQEGL